MSKKEDIMQSAAMLFSNKGFRETSIAEISRMTGAAEGTIFYHFKNKEELFLCILEDVKNGIIKKFETYTQEREFETGLDMMESIINFYLYLAGAMEDWFLLLHRHYLYELARVNPICRSHLEAIYNCLVDIFERAVTAGQNDGSIRDMPARKAALIIFSMIDGAVRLNTYNLYDAGSLHSMVIESCHRMLENHNIRS